MTPSPVEEETSEYLCTLQFPPGSPWLQELERCRCACFRDLGPDETGMYPPHVSVTGFFSATPQQAELLCDKLRKLLLQRAGILPVQELRHLVSTPDGHVLFDVAAPGVAALSADLAAWARSIGVAVRPKAARHLSLASGRSPDEQLRVMELHRHISIGPVHLNLVLSRLLNRSSLDDLASSGQAHLFLELLQLPLPDQRPQQLLSLKSDYAFTPLRKRKTLDGDDDGQHQAFIREITPAKPIKPAATESSSAVAEETEAKTPGAEKRRRRNDACQEAQPQQA